MEGRNRKTNKSRIENFNQVTYMSKLKNIGRYWINQPSSLQPLHKHHGERVIAFKEYQGSFRAFFAKNGNNISMSVSPLALSQGWKE